MQTYEKLVVESLKRNCEASGSRTPWLDYWEERERRENRRLSHSRYPLHPEEEWGWCEEDPWPKADWSDSDWYTDS